MALSKSLFSPKDLPSGHIACPRISTEPFLIILSLVFAIPVIVLAETLKIQDFTYKAKGSRDPFVNPSAGGSFSGSETSKVFKQQDLDKNFDPANLKLKAILKDDKTNPLAILASSVNPQENYLVREGRIRHMQSGLVVKNFEAQVKSEQVILKKANAERPSFVLKLGGQQNQ